MPRVHSWQCFCGRRRWRCRHQRHPTARWDDRYFEWMLPADRRPPVAWWPAMLATVVMLTAVWVSRGRR